MRSGVKEKVELVKQLIQESNGITYEEIAELMETTAKNVATNIVPRYFLTDDRFYKKRDGRNCRLYYKSSGKNAEGYADPTAESAINGVQASKSTIPDDLMPGMTIWVDKELFLIYRVFSDAIVGWKVWVGACNKSVDVSSTLRNAVDSAVKVWSKDGVLFTVYTHRIMSIARSADTTYQMAGANYRCPFDSYRAVVNKFGGNVVEVDIPAEVMVPTVEAPVPVTDTDLALAKQAAEIWERAFMAMAGKLNE